MFLAFWNPITSYIFSNSMNLWDRRTEVSSPYWRCFVRTARSQQKPNVYMQVKQVQSHVWIDIIRYEPHIPYVILFEQRHQFLHCWKINQTVWERIESIIGGWHKTLNLLSVTACKMFSIWDVWHGPDMEQNRKTQLNYQEYAVRTGNHALIFGKLFDCRTRIIYDFVSGSCWKNTAI